MAAKTRQVKGGTAKAAAPKAPARATRGGREPVGAGPGRVGVYAGSFDPPTHGHFDVIRRASRLFDRLIVAVGYAQGKQSLLSPAERLGLIAAECADLTNVSVASFTGLAAAFAVESAASALVRGLRSPSDYAYEMQMAAMNRALAPGLETVFLPGAPELAHVSSSLAKDIATHAGDVELLVPPAVAVLLRRKLRR